MSELPDNSAQTPASADSEQVATNRTIREWQSWLDSRRERLETAKDLEHALTGMTRDKATEHLGGTGERTLYFLIDDCIQLSVHTDRNGRIVLGPTAEKRRKWLKHPDGQLELLEP